MTTATWSSRQRHDSDAMFREWGADFSAKLAAIGLVQTSDTGQINWATATRPVSTTTYTAGYEIWRFDDALQSTAPIFIRFSYGNGQGVNAPGMTATVGTGSNGSGTITGTALTGARVCYVSSSSLTFNSDTAINSYFCFKDGQLSIAFKVSGAAYNSGNQGMGGFLLVNRTVDSSGAPTATGALVMWGQGANSGGATQALRFASTAAAYAVQTSTNAYLGFMAQQQSSTSASGSIQVALGFTWTPRMEPLLSPVGILNGEVTAGTTISVAMIGATARTYLAIPMTTAFGPSGSSLFCGILWE